MSDWWALIPASLALTCLVLLAAFYGVSACTYGLVIASMTLSAITILNDRSKA